MATKDVHQSKERGITMTTRDTFLEKVEAELTERHAQVEKVKAEVSKIKPDARVIYYGQLKALSTKQEAVQQTMEELRLAGRESWEDLKTEIEKDLTGLEEDIDRVKQAVRQADHEVLSWARGIAKEHIIHSIGWAEGIAKEDPVESIGWAEGIAKEDPVESIGWGQGYGQEKVKS